MLHLRKADGVPVQVCVPAQSPARTVDAWPGAGDWVGTHNCQVGGPGNDGMLRVLPRLE